MTSEIEIWNSVWARRREVTPYEERWYELLEHIGEANSPPRRVLEPGCGSGRGLRFFHRASYIVGVDVSAEAIKLCRRSLCDMADVHLIIAELRHLPFKNRTFGLVYNSGVIEHFHPPTDQIVLDELKRVTSKGGRTLIAVPNKTCLWYLVWKALLRLIGKWPYGYERSYFSGEIRRKSSKAGFTVIEQTGILPLPPIRLFKQIKLRSRFGYSLVFMLQRT